MHKLLFLIILIPILSFSQEKNYKKALAAYEKSNNSEALTYVEENLKKHPSSVENILLKSLVLYELSEYDKVVDLLKDRDNLETKHRIILSTSLYETRQFEDAKEILRSLLDDGEKDTIYCNISCCFYYLEKADSAIYYAQRAVELTPYGGVFRFTLGTAYTLNNEADKACGQYFLASKLSYHQAAGNYEAENCESRKEQWLDKLSESNWSTIENSMFPLIKDKMIVTHRTYLFEESGVEQQLKLTGLTKLPTGAVFKFTDDVGHTIFRWADDNGNKDWTLKSVKKLNEL